MAKPRTVQNPSPSPAPAAEQDDTHARLSALAHIPESADDGTADDAAIERMADMLQQDSAFASMVSELTKGGAKVRVESSASMFRYRDGAARFTGIGDGLPLGVKVLSWVDSEGKERESVVLVGKLIQASSKALQERYGDTFLIPCPYQVAKAVCDHAGIVKPRSVRQSAVLLAAVKEESIKRLPDGIVLSVRCGKDGETLYENIKGGRTLQSCQTAVW